MGKGKLILRFIVSVVFLVLGGWLVYRGIFVESEYLDKIFDLVIGGGLVIMEAISLYTLLQALRTR